MGWYQELDPIRDGIREGLAVGPAVISRRRMGALAADLFADTG